tara:strand:+ start:998 stop:1177 length:180 start_codon:yes stop_codon:yes gene_type:complete
VPNPTKVQRRKALERASNTISNYILGAKSGVMQGMYSQKDYNKLSDIVITLDKIIIKMK